MMKYRPARRSATYVAVLMVAAAVPACKDTNDCNVDIEVESYRSGSVSVTISTTGSLCDEQTVNAQFDTIHSVEAKVQAGDTVTFQVLQGPSITCVVDQTAIDRTYLRAKLDAQGALSCTCGTVDFEITNPDDCV